MLSQKEIWEIARKQSALDLNCSPEDFLKTEPVLCEGCLGPGAKKYYREPIACNFVSYGCNVVVSAKGDYRDIAEEYIRKFPFYHCFETPNLHWLNDRLEPLGQRVCFMAEYFLPRPEAVQALPCAYPLRVLEPQDFSKLYLPEWSNALCEKRKELDVLAVGAYDGNTLIALAGCSADAEKMRQIGIDVLPAYRRQGVGAACVSRLALEILKRDLVPFYCAAWSNLPSVRTALKCGFLPAWAEMTVKPREIVEDMNR